MVRTSQGSSRQSGQVSDAIHRAVQCRQQNQSVTAQFGIVGVDHHGFEEGIDGCFECREFA
jgi:hypothetical protein